MNSFNAVKFEKNLVNVKNLHNRRWNISSTDNYYIMVSERPFSSLLDAYLISVATEIEIV